MNTIAPLDYEKFLDTALRSAVIQSLKQVSQSGFPGNHHFYISFRTQYPGVAIPDWLIDRYPDEMTIVLQHQFSNLIVTNEGFSVSLNFNNLPQNLKIPVRSITSFSDPEAPFALQFDTSDDSSELVEEAKTPRDDQDSTPIAFPRAKASGRLEASDAARSVKPLPAEGDDLPTGGAEVVAFDQFRRK
ncbi:MAG: ClpXP protease specificity-enhancing factor SspB [Candidatus Pacebacteria bacterium]|nr:ClpXP protease specificity-enhancing factor SspB [Candidatus Paceibacterota bacterium]